MKNPVEWLFRDQDLLDKEKELDEHLERVREKVNKVGKSMLVEIDADFPENFTKLSKEIARGHVEWRDFYCNKSLDIYSAHCKMNKGAMLKEHRHPKFNEYIYVISGSIINWLDSDSEAKIITPPEKIEPEDGNHEGWHKIPAGVNHRIQCMEENTHFVSKFLREDVEPG